jgi:hypothetical protein
MVISVFLTWYSLNLGEVLRAAASQLPAQLSGSLSAASARAGGLTVTSSGWHAVHTIRLVALVVGVAALINSMTSSTTLGDRKGLLLLVGGLLAAVLTAYRIASPPGALDISFGPFQFSSPAGAGAALSPFLHVHAGPWAALVGSALVSLGGWAQLGSERTVLAVPVPSFPVAPASKPPPGS